jgi:dolichol-phosphate mannosyltransferase
VAGASMGGFAESRVRLSNFGLKLSRLILHAEVHDPMSGFFLVDRKFVEETIYRTSGIGFKILVDLLASTRRPVNLSEIPYTFRNREAGESKLDFTVGLEYLYLVLDKLVGDFIPLRFVLYTMVGAAGVLLHLATLGLLYATGYAPFATAQIVATVAAMTFNFLLNNLVTYRDAKLKGNRLVIGLASFYLACSIGAILNLAISEQLLRYGVPWLSAGFTGLAISSVWNYAITNVTTWRRKRWPSSRKTLS